ncbi:hypothetical protein N0V91_004371 [Didymella pomorum]|uniref:Borealin N-terminal domain-containing protein n=1 Tax=Didymella pomorum TaxID=749634 RepID=A0A9W9D991_9PLEO|nr:hypothetical protein N0V91_004371 [Didymella pomorum]
MVEPALTKHQYLAPIKESLKTSLLANFELEVAARRKKLQQMADAQCASLLSRLERRVNRVPMSRRNKKFSELFNPYDIMEPEARAAADITRRRSALYEELADTPEEPPAPPPAKKAPTKKAATTSKAPTKPRHAPSKSAPTASLATSSTRAKKRSSDEANSTPSDDKENVAGSTGANKKRARAATTTAKNVAANKPAAPAARATRAASRRTAPGDILSPKNENVKAPTSRAKPAPSNKKAR